MYHPRLMGNHYDIGRHYGELLAKSEFIELQAPCYISAARGILAYLYFFISAVPVCHA